MVVGHGERVLLIILQLFFIIHSFNIIQWARLIFHLISQDNSAKPVDGMLRIVSKILKPRKDKGDKSAVTPFDSRNHVIRTKRGLNTPKPTPY